MMLAIELTKKESKQFSKRLKLSEESYKGYLIGVVKSRINHIYANAPDVCVRVLKSKP